MNRGSGDPLPIIHLALGAGLLLFAAVLFVVGGPLRVEEGSVLRWVWLGVALLAVLAAGAIRGRLAAEVEPARRRAGAITIWALAEGQALLGLVFYLLTGDVVPPAVGVLLFFFLWWRYRPTALPGAS